MAIIRVSCESGSELEVYSFEMYSHDLWLNIFTYPNTPPQYQYGFRCPVHQLVELKPADERIKDLLEQHEVPVLRHVMPGLERVELSPLTESVIDDFAIDLHDWPGMPG